MRRVRPRPVAAMTLRGRGVRRGSPTRRRLRFAGGTARPGPRTRSTLAADRPRRRRLVARCVGGRAARPPGLPPRGGLHPLRRPRDPRVRRRRPLRPDTVAQADGERIDRLIALSGAEVAATLVAGSCSSPGSTPPTTATGWTSRCSSTAPAGRSAGGSCPSWASGVRSRWSPTCDVAPPATGTSTSRARRAGGGRRSRCPTSCPWSPPGSTTRPPAPPMPSRRPTSRPSPRAATWEGYTSALTILAAVLAIVVVREISARVLAEPAENPGLRPAVSPRRRGRRPAGAPGGRRRRWTTPGSRRPRPSAASGTSAGAGSGAPRRRRR